MASADRDLRLDFFRGLALWFIFIDHVPSSVIGNLTLRNFGFSDATEIFVFISGYTAAIVYGKSRDEHGLVFMTLQVLKRCWQLYAAHILVFVFFVAQVAWAANRLENASILEELNVSEFLENPTQSLVQALLLRYRPVNLDVLPLYMVLLLGLPLLLFLERFSRRLVLLASLALWLLVQIFKWSFPIYEDGSVWYFNPLGWQLLFVIGVLCAVSRSDDSPWLRWRPWLGALSIAWLTFSLLVCIAWKYPAFNDLIEPYVELWLYPIDKNNLGEARVLHFLAVAYLAGHYVSAESPLLRWRVLDPVIRCGQHSLYIFCVGILLSFVAHIMLVEFGRGIAMQLVVIVGGLVLMSALAYQLHWFRAKSRDRPIKTPSASALSIAGLCLVMLIGLAPQTASAQTVASSSNREQRCSVPAELVPSQDSLPALSKALKDRAASPTLVVLSPQSGSIRPGLDGGPTYPVRLESELASALTAELKQRRLKVTVIGKPRAATAELAALIGKQVLPLKPSLVIWQIGRSDARKGIPPYRFAEQLDAGINLLRAQGIDTIVLDLQYHPQFEALFRTDEYRKHLRWVAGKRDLSVFRRYEMIEHWQGEGRVDLDSVGAEIEKASYDFIQDCVSFQLSRMIVSGTRLAR